MTVITLSTVGYGETRELSHSGRFFAALLISVSVVSMACWTASITSSLVSGELTGSFIIKKDRKLISSFKNHTVVCGGGELAQTVIYQLIQDQKQVVVIVNDPEETAVIRQRFQNVPVVEDDPKAELALADANILAASYLIVATDSDVDNLLITISGSALASELKVISFANNSQLSSRMIKVGADEVICPLVLGGVQAAKLVA